MAAVTHVDVKRAGFPKRLSAWDLGYDDSGFFLIIGGLFYAVGWVFFYMFWLLRGRTWLVVEWSHRNAWPDKIVHVEQFGDRDDAENRRNELRRGYGF